MKKRCEKASYRNGKYGSLRTYQQSFDHMLACGTIVKRGMQEDAKLFDELVFDVNSDYFERNGGYDFAVKFYQQAFELAVKEVGGGEYILSAVLRADERNKALSEQLGRDVYHYHLHVVYIPIVQKEVKWTKRCKDPALVGTVKEVVTQINHTDKWPRIKVGRGYINEHAKLQDRYFEHMKAAGFDGFERGERGSTTEHLEVLDYKIQQDEKRLYALEQRIEKKQERVEKLNEKIEVKKSQAATIDEVNSMGHGLPLVPGVHFSDDEAAKLKKLAKKSVTIQEQLNQTITRSKQRQDELDKQIAGLQYQLADAKREVNHWHRKYTDLWNEVKNFIQLIRRFPERVKALADELFPPKIEQEREHAPQTQIKKKSYDRGL